MPFTIVAPRVRLRHLRDDEAERAARLHRRGARTGLIDEEVWVIEADMDDMETEYMGAVADGCAQAGALDVLYFPVQMKKGRVGHAPFRRSPSACPRRPHRDGLQGDDDLRRCRLRPEFRTVLCEKEEIARDVLRPGHGEERATTDRAAGEDPRGIRRGQADRRRAGMPYRSLLDALKKEL